MIQDGQNSEGVSVPDRATAVEPVPVSPLRDGIANAVHIRNGRAKLLPHVYGGGETWCGKKLIGKPDDVSGDVEKFSIYGNTLKVTIDPALGDCHHCRSAFNAAYSDAFPDGLKPIATFHLDSPEEMKLAKALLSPEGIKRLLSRDSQRCSMGVGCDEYGVCYAEAHGRPDLCPAQAIEAGTAKTEGLGAQHESAVHAPKHNQEPTNG